MLVIKDLDKLKITSVREFKMHFRYDDVLYVLQEDADGYEHNWFLMNRDTGEVVAKDYDCLGGMDNLIGRWKHKPIVYKHIDKEYFVKQLLRYKIVICEIPKPYNNHIMEKIECAKLQLEYHIKEVKKYKNKIKELESRLKEESF